MFRNFTTKDEESISPIGFTLDSIQLTTNSGFKLEISDLTFFEQPVVHGMICPGHEKYIPKYSNMSKYTCCC